MSFIRRGGILAACALATSLVMAAGPAAAAAPGNCAVAPPPVLTLAFGSRYTGDSETRSQIDERSNEEVNTQLRPVDDFLRDLTDLANAAMEQGSTSGIADCVLSQIETWAAANALADLRGNARMTIGSRLAGFGLVLMQALPLATDTRPMQIIGPWLSARMTDHMIFWEAEGPRGAGQGNLRAWSGLAAATIGTVLEDPVIRGWGAWSTSYVLCTANPDGSLPQEMKRGHLALHYQLHAVAPLTVSAAILSRKGLDLTARCDFALDRIVQYTVNDLETGQATARNAGVVQNFFDGTGTLEPWQLAWLEAYLSIHYDPGLIQLADTYRPLSYSKLGGDQTLLWSELRW